MKIKIFYITCLIIFINVPGITQTYRSSSSISTKANARIHSIENGLTISKSQNPIMQFDINKLMQQEFILTSTEGVSHRFKADTIIQRKNGLLSWVGKNISTGDFVNYVINKDLKSFNGSLVLGNHAYEVFGIDPGVSLLVHYNSFSNLVCGTNPPPFLSTIPRQKKTERMSGQDCNLRGIFAYTPAVKSSVLDIRGLIQAAIDYTNLAYDNSLIDFHLEAAVMYETNYVETGVDVGTCWIDGLGYPSTSQDLCRFHHIGDGWMDEVHDYRDQYKADVCILFISMLAGRGGQSFLPPIINGGEAFAVCVFNNTISTTAHEIGHIQGCHHDYALDPTATNNHGYVHIGATLEESFHTVMAYPNQCVNNFGSACREIPYFSHPDIFFEGVPIGENDPLDIDGAKNAINIMNQKALVNGFRDYPAFNTLPSTTIPSETFAYPIASTELGNLTTYVIEDSSTVHFSSENYITLRPGFQSQEGAFFEGKIDAFCTPPFVSPNSRCTEFGYSLDMHGDFAVIGDPIDNTWGPEAGKVYLFEKTEIGWKFRNNIYSPLSQEGDRFGHSVAIHDSLIIIGAPFKDGSQPGGGRAYIFSIQEDSTIIEEKSWINVGVSGSQDKFGFAVDIYGNRAVVGSPGDSEHGTNSGSVTAYYKAGGSWFLSSEYFVPGEDPGDELGYSVAIDYYRIAAGVPGFDSIHPDQGKVSTFVSIANNYTYFNDAYNKDLPAYSRLGHDIDNYGIRLIAGAPGDSRKGLQSGSAHVFRQSGTIFFQEEILIPDDLNPFDRFGYSVAIDSSDAIVGAPKKSVVAETARKVYTYSRDGTLWSSENTLQQLSPLNAMYAHSISISDSVTIVSALSDFPICDIKGAVYSYIQAPTGFWILEPGDLEASARQIDTKLNSRQDEGIRRE
ncbi:MAG: hypothetical protein HKN68_05115 [Saprospiraceae bacterium]|nr:hypothetical protein [Saprospiraceae bacterium]